MKRPPLHTIVQRRFFVFTQKLPAFAARRQGTNSEFCSDERVGYTLLKSFLAGDVNANRCYAGLSPEEQQRLVSGAKSLRTPDEVASYVWDYLDRQGR